MSGRMGASVSGPEPVGWSSPRRSVGTTEDCPALLWLAGAMKRFCIWSRAHCSGCDGNPLALPEGELAWQGGWKERWRSSPVRRAVRAAATRSGRRPRARTSSRSISVRIFASGQLSFAKRSEPPYCIRRVLRKVPGGSSPARHQMLTLLSSLPWAAMALARTRGVSARRFLATEFVN
jgi:hypothetical protein